MKIFVVSNMELGWDNVVAVFSESKYSKKELEEVFSSEKSYVILTRYLDDHDIEEYR